MEEPIFYEIPIYRCTLCTHTIYMKDEEQKWMSFQNKEVSPDSYQSAYDYFHHDFWYPWHYNEIIGYLNLYIFGSQFRIDIWFIKKQRIKKGIIKKKFFFAW